MRYQAEAGEVNLIKKLILVGQHDKGGGIVGGIYENHIIKMLLS